VSVFWKPQYATNDELSCCLLVRNLMYGFGDDRNPANDTVNVMEEILIEYIVDVVSGCNQALLHHPRLMLGTAVFHCFRTDEEAPSFRR